MSDLSSVAKANIESARQHDGKFGTQPHSNPGQLDGLTEEQPTCTTLPDGTKEWSVNDKLHRVDGPAVEYTDGSKEWYVNDKLHRVDGPAVEGASGYKEWWLDGRLHRTDGPAIEYASSGAKEWWLDGQRHRTDGPAVERADGAKMWYLRGECLTEAEHAERTS